MNYLSREEVDRLIALNPKLEVGAASTIFNTNGDKTNFLYRISGISAADMQAINGIGKFQAKFQRLNELDAQIEFAGIVGKVLRNNLNYADGHLPAILARMILLYYSTSLSKISAITERVKTENPLGFDYSDNQDFYEHKVKRLLTECTLGLKGTTVWRGKYEATGGYLIPRKRRILYQAESANQIPLIFFVLKLTNIFQNSTLHNSSIATII